MNILNTGADQTLAHASRALEAGRMQACREMAETAFLLGHRTRNLRMKAGALLLTAQADVLDSRMGSAAHFAHKAAQAFEKLQELPDQAKALAMLSYAQGCAGLIQESKENAQACALLAEPFDDVLGSAMGLNYLGVAAFWAGDVRESQDVLETAASMVLSVDTPSLDYQPLVNMCFNKLLQVHRLSLAAGSIQPGAVVKAQAPCQKLMELLSRAQRLDRVLWPTALSERARHIARTLLHYGTALGLLYQGEARHALPYLVLGEHNAMHLPAGSWLHAMSSWYAAEEARLRGDLEGAKFFAQKMLQASRAGHNRPMQGLAQGLIDHCQGRYRA